MNRLFLRTGLILLTGILLAVNGLGQMEDKSEKGKYKHGFCEGQSWSKDDRVSARDLRELTVPAAYQLKVNSENGRITVKGENRSDVLVRACVKTWGATAVEADAAAKAVRIETSPEVRAVNLPERDWSVSYEILVPTAMNLDLGSKNGRITISSVQGQMRFATGNGRVTLEDVGGDIKGRTGNGRVTVSLTGAAWQGAGGLDVETGNGRITLYMPANYAANVEVGTSHGRFSSDFEQLRPANDKPRQRYEPKKVSASLNGGGAPIRLVTTNGRVSIKAKDRVRYE